jgi:hypothetical protein
MTPARIAIAFALLITSSATTAQSATDASCFLLSNAFAQSTKDANAQKAAEAASYFYLGRIGNRATAAQLKALFDAQAKAITDATAPTMMNACIKELQAKADLVQSLAPKEAAQPPQAQQPPKK